MCVPEENWELNDTFEGSNDAFYTKMSPALYSHPHLPYLLLLQNFVHDAASQTMGSKTFWEHIPKFSGP